MIVLEELFMFHELRNQGLSISEIARSSGRARNTVRKHLRRALEAPAYTPRSAPASKLVPYKGYLANFD